MHRSAFPLQKKRWLSTKQNDLLSAFVALERKENGVIEKLIPFVWISLQLGSEPGGRDGTRLDCRNRRGGRPPSHQVHPLEVASFSAGARQLRRS